MPPRFVTIASLSLFGVACFSPDAPEQPTRPDDTETESDTDADADADTDTDTDTDTDAPPWIVTTIPAIQQGAFEPGAMLRLEQVSVVGPQLEAGFHVADPSMPDSWGGLWLVFPEEGQRVLEDGASVTVIGTYTELSTELDGEMGDGTLSALVLVEPWESLGATDPVEPTIVELSVLLDPDTAEPYEGMLLRVEDVTVTTGGLTRWQLDGGLTVGDLYHHGAALTGATFAAVQGVLWYERGGFVLCPRDEGDLQGYDAGLDDCGDAVCIDALGTGELIVTEIMRDPEAVVDDLGEWFELYNAGESAVDLRGLEVSDDGGDGFVVTEHTVVEPGAFAVLAASGDTSRNGGVSAAWDYPYTSLSLANGADELILAHGGVIFDRVAWDDGVTFPSLAGAAMALAPDHLDAGSNDDGANWCTATSTYGDGDLGTPGAANTACGE